MDKLDINSPQISKLIELALNEDIGTGDITTDNLISTDEISDGYIIAKENGIISGLPLFDIIMKKLDNNFLFYPEITDGTFISQGEKIALFKGRKRSILSAERTALNFLQRMSGISTLTSKFVQQLEGTNTKLLDTRKTLPGHRILDKYAVKMGGGTNHRVGLFDMVMIKDNHIKAAGSINSAVSIIKSKIKSDIKIEVEVSNLEEVKEALSAGCDIIMLDNMDIDTINKARKLISNKVSTEISGNVNIENIKNYASTGVNYISVGAITHSVKALDISLYII
jgi:nicotinate-nucleotide pyrophosphorylase (carboxylating)